MNGAGQIAAEQVHGQGQGRDHAEGDDNQND